MRTYGEVPDPFAAYGYTSMAMLLDAIERAGSQGNQRDDVIRETFDTSHFRSPVGTFSIDDNGDTSLKAIAGYRIRNGRPVVHAGAAGAGEGVDRRAGDRAGGGGLPAGAGAVAHRGAAPSSARSARAIPARRASSETDGGDSVGDPAVEHARDHVLLGELLVGDDVGDRLCRGELHLLRDLGARASRAPRKMPGKHSTLLIWFG